VTQIHPRHQGFELNRIANKFELQMQKVAIGKKHVRNHSILFHLSEIVEMQEIEECSNVTSTSQKKRD